MVLILMILIYLYKKTLLEHLLVEFKVSNLVHVEYLMKILSQTLMQQILIHQLLKRKAVISMENSQEHHTQIVNNTIKLPISGPSYGYIIVPMEFVQPSEFRNSNEACTGFLIPMLTLGSIIIPDENGFDVKYIIYRTFNKTSGSVDVWFCD